MKLTIFKTPKPRRFDYSPRYYDEREDRRKRTKKIADELRSGSDGILDTEGLRANMHERWQKGRKASKSDLMGSRGMNLVIIVAVLLLVAYLIFYLPIF